MAVLALQQRVGNNRAARLFKPAHHVRASLGGSRGPGQSTINIQPNLGTACAFGGRITGRHAHSLILGIVLGIVGAALWEHSLSPERAWFPVRDSGPNVNHLRS